MFQEMVIDIQILFYFLLQTAKRWEFWLLRVKCKSCKELLDIPSACETKLKFDLMKYSLKGREDDDFVNAKFLDDLPDSFCVNVVEGVRDR